MESLLGTEVSIYLFIFNFFMFFILKVYYSISCYSCNSLHGSISWDCWSLPKVFFYFFLYLKKNEYFCLHCCRKKFAILPQNLICLTKTERIHKEYASLERYFLMAVFCHIPCIVQETFLRCDILCAISAQQMCCW